eukprot:TRINITY_DN952_c0_g2_i2.p1 TRINITY_DN952_c0_g2~~TRINITY_DN952_c0_g2_i2.p1  ORF type:complete len:589 (+),score=102.02 TRINITY_DN952_c0_g2_i2:106-1767(+)
MVHMGNTLLKLISVGAVVYFCVTMFFLPVANEAGANLGSDYVSALTEMLSDRKLLGETNWREGVDQNMEDAMKQLFAEMDTDGDGYIKFDEFKTLMPLQTWAAFRAFDLALKSRVPSFSGIREKLHSRFENGLAFPIDLTYSQSLYQYFTNYLMFLLFVQCILCAWENVLPIIGFREFTFPEKPDLQSVKKLPKPPCLQYDTPLVGWYEVTKTILMTLSLLPVMRIFQFVGFFFIGLCAVNIAVVIPYKWWKVFWLDWITSLCISGVLFSAGYYRVGIEGKIAPKSECKMFVGNHTAIYEVMILFGLSFPAFISRVENAAIPLFSGVVRACDAILVDRNDRNSRKKTMNEIRKRSKTADAPQLMIFPEGTVGNGKGLFVFKSGAFETGEPVQPVCFKFPYSHYNPCWTGEAVGGNEVGELIWRGMCQVINRVEVKILPVYHPSEEEKADSRLFAENVRLLMAANLRAGISDCSYEDYVKLQKTYYGFLRREQAAGVRRRKRDFWLPLSRKRRILVEELMLMADDDENNSVTSCEEDEQSHNEQGHNEELKKDK